jgi:hypothetical protein
VDNFAIRCESLVRLLGSPPKVGSVRKTSVVVWCCRYQRTKDVTIKGNGSAAKPTNWKYTHICA